MKKENFKLDRIERKDGHEDYWFETDSISDKELSEKYMEMCMVGVAEVVYSRDKDIVGIKRLFPFNYDVIISDDDDLKKMLKELAQEVHTDEGVRENENYKDIQ